MVFYSHSQEDINGKIKPTKKLEKHLIEVANNIESNFHAIINFDRYSITPSFLKVLGLFHDLGKFTTFFQDYLLSRKVVNASLKQHSQISAVFAYNYLQEQFPEENLLSFIVYYCIKHHHGNLANPNKKPNRSHQESIRHSLIAQKKDILCYSSTEIKRIIKDGFNDLHCFQGIDNYFKFNEDKITKTANRIQNRAAGIENYFITLYLFSLLISSDKIDAGDVNKFKPQTIRTDIVDRYILNLTVKKLNNIRAKAKSDIEYKLDEIDIKNDKLFTITAPTGIGKTLSVINFAIKLKDKIRRTQHYNPQIIYCLPFINIIEQTYKVFSQLFRDESISLLQHHQYTDICALYDKKESEDEEKELSKKLLEVEDWQADIILTTFVQFFHSVITNKNKLLKKFHRFAGSIIILDEIQNIKAEYWPLIGATLFHLSHFLNCRIVLMTATQPLIFKTADDEIFNKQDEVKYKKLLNEKETKYLFNQFNRTKIISLIDAEKPIKTDDDFYKLFSSKWDKAKSCLIVVNTIKRSLAIFDKLTEELNSNRIFYLSTNIIPLHRKYIIRKIKSLLEKNEKVILVSTQSIEAGVDLDFDMGLRDIGPLDSIIQVAGRINRNDREGFQDSPLYLLNFIKDAQRVYGRIIIDASLKLLNSDKKYFYEKEYLSLIQQYYDLIVDEDRTSFDESRKLYSAMKKMKFSNDFEGEELSIQDFRLIDDIKTNYADVFIQITKHAATILERYMNEYLICKDTIKKIKIYLKIKSSFNQYKISVPMKIIESMNNKTIGITELIKNRLYAVRKENIGSYSEKKTNILYNYSTGFCRDEIKDETTIF